MISKSIFNVDTQISQLTRQEMFKKMKKKGLLRVFLNMDGLVVVVVCHLIDDPV